ncbi:AAA family ATPase [Silanimonas sp.]|uniref:AAA family ATPase n=1 Tax=Silanimonas sp. TaxID=1929290 RepID=UPI0037CAF849
MKLTYVEICGFRGYRKSVRIDFASDFTVIDGRNGVGKSTVFDAVEFAITGKLSKHANAKADGESVADYIWWSGDGAAPSQRYVEVGFRDADGDFSARRSALDGPNDLPMEELISRLCFAESAPRDAVTRLCSSSIIRDESIAALSLDLKETERYSLLRDGLGANDADAWTSRGAQLVGSAKKRLQLANQDVEAMKSQLAATHRRRDEVESSLANDEAILASAQRARELTGADGSPDRLIGPLRQWIARATEEATSLERVIAEWNVLEDHRDRIAALYARRSAALAAAKGVSDELDGFSTVESGSSSTELSKRARDLIALASLGRSLGLHDGSCPLCQTSQDHESFWNGIAAAEELAGKMDLASAEAQKREQAVSALQLKRSELLKSLESITAELASLERKVSATDQVIEHLKAKHLDHADQIISHIEKLRSALVAAQHDLRVLETIKLSAQLEQVKNEVHRLESMLSSVEERAGKARRCERTAQALYDAARRASGETLDQRLERVLPLLSELYQRLRPHPVWRDIEYSIRGDVKKFLKLKVGDDLNPQFLFSSGQRRATGLAFLISVKLSLAWGKWRSLLLDDPVQHVDDFRSIHLAEVAAQLILEGNQIICAVEDSALAEMLCRRLPVRNLGAGKRVTLGVDERGDHAIVSERVMQPLFKNALALGAIEAHSASSP